VESKVHDSGGVSVSVEDTGRGIEPKDLDRIFNPLFTTKREGFGMGLAICRSVIEAHEGRLWAAPNRSQGAVFQFILPADTAMSARRHERDSDRGHSRPGG
jgi:signal transduction histidine kinase